MDMTDYRKQIDEIDAQLTELFQKRMDTAAQIAAYKKENGLPVFDPARERAKLADIASKVRPEMQGYAESLYSTMFDLSRSYQRKLNSPRNDTQQKISEALANTPNLFPERPFVACQGVEGAYSQHACTRIFKSPNIMYFSSFEGVFRAIDQGLCKYGVLPLENSTAGSVNRVYDL